MLTDRLKRMVNEASLESKDEITDSLVVFSVSHGNTAQMSEYLLRAL